MAKKPTREQLEKAANELNELLFETPEIPTGKKAKEEDMIFKINEAVELLEPTDELTKSTLKTIKELAAWSAEQIEDAEEVEDEDGDDEDEDDADDADDAEDAEEVTEEEDEDDDEDEEPEPAPKKSTKKTAAPAPPKKEEKKDKPAPAEKKATKTAAPKGKGVIATIVECIENAGKKGVTKEEILKTLVKEFPDREKTSMKKTIDVQVPNRITKERFEVKTKDGVYSKA